MNAISRAIAAAAKAQTRNGGVTILYRRGGEEVELTALPGSTNYESTNADSSLVQVQVRDYLIIAAELILAGEPVLPEREDRIVEEFADGEHTFEVLDIPGQPAWRWSDEQHVRLRVHTKEIDHA